MLASMSLRVCECVALAHRSLACTCARLRACCPYVAAHAQGHTDIAANVVSVLRRVVVVELEPRPPPLGVPGVLAPAVGSEPIVLRVAAAHLEFIDGGEGEANVSACVCACNSVRAHADSHESACA